jgi:hypothetical protein
MYVKITSLKPPDAHLGAVLTMILSDDGHVYILAAFAFDTTTQYAR